VRSAERQIPRAQKRGESSKVVSAKAGRFLVQFVENPPHRHVLQGLAKENNDAAGIPEMVYSGGLLGAKTEIPAKRCPCD